MSKRQYPVLNGDYYYHYWPERDPGVSFWHLRKKDNARVTIAFSIDEVKQIFAKHGASVSKVDLGQTRVAVCLPKGTKARELEGAFTELASLFAR